jgi:gas vesicle protein
MGSQKSDNFVWGLLAGGAIGFAIASYLSTDAGKERLETLRSRTVELTGDPEQLRQRAVSTASTMKSAVGDAIQEGIGAARQRGEELASKAAQVTDLGNARSKNA